MKDKMMAALRETGVVAILRADSSEDLITVSRALVAGGVRFIEITMTTPGALETIRKAKDELSDLDVYIGVGTVLDAETARAAIIAGARFVVSPGFDLETVRVCHTYSVLAMPGALTPTEIIQAWKQGADVVKVFPANNWGPDYIKAIKEPLPQVELLPTGKIDASSAAAFIKAGVIAVGAGSLLVDRELIAKKNTQQITENARKLRQVVDEARKSR